MVVQAWFNLFFFTAPSLTFSFIQGMKFRMEGVRYHSSESVWDVYGVL